MNKLIAIAIVLFAAWQLINRERQIEQGPGIKAPNIPVQQANSPVPVTPFKDYYLSEFASFTLTAKVLDKENYYFDSGADLSPTDLALGWGRMSDESILEHIDISQRGRFYYWRVDSFPIPRQEIETHSANMHIIPANDYVAGVLKDINPGNIIELEGSLVDIVSTDGSFYWNSSRTRNDTGGGACEVIYVTGLRIIS